MSVFELSGENQESFGPEELCSGCNQYPLQHEVDTLSGTVLFYVNRFCTGCGHEEAKLLDAQAMNELTDHTEEKQNLILEGISRANSEIEEEKIQFFAKYLAEGIITPDDF